MGTIIQSVSGLSWKNCHPSQNHAIAQEKVQSRTRAASVSAENQSATVKNIEFGGLINRRAAIASGIALVSSAAFGFPGEGLAVVKQGLLAGRIPGLSEPDEQGWRTYQRPDEKSGGHGVGWSPIIPYKFSVPDEWSEVPVSIADLGGTEIDLRFASPKQGRISVIVAPVLRFSDNLGDNATIDQVGTPEKVISAFGPEVIGENIEGKVLSSQVAVHEGRTYYQFELEPPHVIITATAAGNRLYLFNVTGNGNDSSPPLQSLNYCCYYVIEAAAANSSARQLSWYGRTAAQREILLYTSSRTRFLNRTSIGVEGYLKPYFLSDWRSLLFESQPD